MGATQIPKALAADLEPGSSSSGRHPLPASFIRQAFRTSPEWLTQSRALDEGFSALRAANMLCAWLQPNDALHTLQKAGASIEDGAAKISDALHPRADGSSHAAEVSERLDEIADLVRKARDDAAFAVPPTAQFPSSSRLQLLALVNHVRLAAARRHPDSLTLSLPDSFAP